MGFDQFFSIENWGEEMDRLRNYCSDQSLYNRIIDLYNSKEKDQKNFIFCVTMQNHGGYTEERSAGYEPDVKLIMTGNIRWRRCIYLWQDSQMRLLRT